MKPVNPADFTAYFEYSVRNFNMLQKIFYAKVTVHTCGANSNMMHTELQNEQVRFKTCNLALATLAKLQREQFILRGILPSELQHANKEYCNSRSGQIGKTRRIHTASSL